MGGPTRADTSGSRNGRAISSTKSLKSSGCCSHAAEMSLKLTPGEGKSATTRTAALTARRRSSALGAGDINAAYQRRRSMRAGRWMHLFGDPYSSVEVCRQLHIPAVLEQPTDLALCHA